MSTPANTIAFTIQVVPKSSAKVVMLFVSNRRKAAPMKKRSTYPRIAPNGPATRRTLTKLARRIAASASR